MQVALGTAKNKASVRTIPLPPKVVRLLKQFPFEKGWGTASQLNIRLKSLNPDLTSHSFRHGITDLGRNNTLILLTSRPYLATGSLSVRCPMFMDRDMTQRS